MEIPSGGPPAAPYRVPAKIRSPAKEELETEKPRNAHPENSKLVPFNINYSQRRTQAVPSVDANKMEYVCVCSYTKLDNLAHQPKGTPAAHTMTVFGLDHASGRLTKLNVSAGLNKEFENAAFVRSHPKKNILYVVTESIHENGWLAVRISAVSRHGAAAELGKVSTHGRSACYISLSHDLRYILVVNYWDSTMTSIAIDEEGLFLTNDGTKSQIPGNNAEKKREAHGNDPHSKHRFDESHAHACVFDPTFGRMAFVPDLGEGVIKQFAFDENNGSARYCGTISCGAEAGPRYLEFHPQLDVCYVVNELASSIVVLRFDEYRVLEAFERLHNTVPSVRDPKQLECAPCLEKIQEISTLPAAFPKNMNTCGRIAVDPSGKWVLVSNRGHDSIAVYQIVEGGLLINAGYYDIGGHTPRHFKFSTTGDYVFSANQDSNCICVFRFDKTNGELRYKQSYSVDSPNFIEVKAPASGRKLAPWVYARM
eukprot:CAMPEP_0179007778 /NCGR_PEP_ID=MMETSP0795-20121207/15348_1 /TAXON_ID=88552 /ORGANISM="Amoebophrya sp., Strain Ameob2" /LENGTH=481 /DNA_ID=CAMNT_0020702787 /DNA_START=325 /DNA_END=1771 /DNA_ORIENTATION=-